ncbi:MAG: ribonuclease P protein component [bacterium]|nr:ribonuclease P protein component [bacterium]
MLSEKGHSKSYTLRKKREFEELFKNGKRVASRFFATFFLAKEEKRIGIIVSKKVSKKAVIRNRVRRRIREIYRLNKEDMPQGWIMVIARKEITEADFPNLKRAFLSLSKRI